MSFENEIEKKKIGNWGRIVQGTRLCSGLGMAGMLGWVHLDKSCPRWLYPRPRRGGGKKSYSTSNKYVARSSTSNFRAGAGLLGQSITGT